MCGISGLFSNNPINNIRLRMTNMVESMNHRGPDFQNFEEVNQGIAFGHNRLSIIDLSEASNQPMMSESKRYMIVFNGEIFNFEEIKRELSYPFHSNGDTEVILAAVELHGIDWFLQKANGMFAFALYDTLDNKLFLVRDRFSIKPLYYTIKDDVLIFASEIKGILNSGLFEPEFNEAAIDEYLGNRQVREPFTFFKDIFQVCGGEYLTFNQDLTAVKKTYYQLPLQNFDVEYDEEKIIEETTEKVVEAIKRWTIADVKVGAYLSGGVDSSLTTAVMASNLTDTSKLCTYTIGFEESNEFEYAEIVAQKYGLKHKSIMIDYHNYLEEWERLIYFNDAPLGVPNEIPLSIMSTELKKDITVVISGEGADELFGGYGKIYRLPFDFEKEQNSHRFYDALIEQYEYVPRSMRDKFLITDKSLRGHFDIKISSDFKNYRNEENVFRFFQQYHVKGLLKRVDMTTMQTAVEARPPFLDHELIDFVSTQIPYELKLKWKSDADRESAKSEQAKQYSEVRDVPKYILKKVAERFLPNEIIYRKKVGFPVPLYNWLPQLRELVTEYLNQVDWLDANCIEDLMTEAENNERAGQILWMFINIELFRRQFFYNKKWKY